MATKYLITYSNGKDPSVHTSYAAARRATKGYGTPDGTGDVWVYANRADLYAARDGSTREIAVVRQIVDAKRFAASDECSAAWARALGFPQ